MSPLRVLAALVGLVLLGLAVVGSHELGRSHGAEEQVARRLAQDLAQHERTLAVEAWFLEGARTSPSTRGSGRWTLEVHMADTPPRTVAIEVEVEDGRIVRLEAPTIENVRLEGSRVTWDEHGEDDEAPRRRFVGVVDGDEFWGRVLQPPGQGWHEGEPAVIGAWRSVAR